MDNVTKIKFQYFKPLEKGTEKRKAGREGARRAAAGTQRRPRGRGPGGWCQEGAGLVRGAGPAGSRAPPPRRAATPGLPAEGFGAPPARPGASRPGPPHGADPRQRRRAAGSRRSGVFPHRHRDPRAPAAASPGTSFSSGSTREKPWRANERAPSS